MIDLYNKIKKAIENEINVGKLYDNSEYLIFEDFLPSKGTKLTLEILDTVDKNRMYEEYNIIKLSFEKNNYLTLKIDIIKRNVETVEEGFSSVTDEDYGYSYNIIFGEDYQVEGITKKEIIANTINKKDYEDLDIKVEHLQFYLNNFNDLTEEKKDIFKISFDCSIEDLDNLNNLKNKLNTTINIIDNKTNKKNKITI